MAKEKAAEKKNWDETIKQMNKEYGLGSVIVGKWVIEDVETVSSGSLELDIATGIGGIPLAKNIEIYGPESSGKSTLTQTIIGNYQKLEKAKSEKTGLPPRRAVLCDGENSLDPEYATALGIDLDSLVVIQLDEFAGEGAWEKIRMLVETGEVGLVVIDSYNSLQPKSVVEGEYGKSNIGKHAILMGQACQRNTFLGQKYNCGFIYIGQLRQAVGVMYGPTETTQGGLALRYYSHMRLKITRSTTEANSQFDGDEKIGNLTKVSVDKNKLARPFRKAEFNIIYGQGIDKLSEIIALGADYEIFKKRAGVITHGELKYSIEEFTKVLQDNEEFRVSLEEQIKQKAYASKDKEVVEVSVDTHEEAE